jgi:uncharacterized protein
MQVNVAQLLKEPVGSSRNLTINEWVGGKENEFHIAGEAMLIHIDKGVLLKAKLKARGQGICSRCLKAAKFSTDFSIEEEYSPTLDINSGLPLQVKDEEFTIDEHHVIDLSDALYQYASLAVPMKLLCKKECAGMCPVCGKNLNETKCDCSKRNYDKRWSKLFELKQEETSNGTTA